MNWSTHLFRFPWKGRRGTKSNLWRESLFLLFSFRISHQTNMKFLFILLAPIRKGETYVNLENRYFLLITRVIKTLFSIWNLKSDHTRLIFFLIFIFVINEMEYHILTENADTNCLYVYYKHINKINKTMNNYLDRVLFGFRWKHTFFSSEQTLFVCASIITNWKQSIYSHPNLHTAFFMYVF